MTPLSGIGSPISVGLNIGTTSSPVGDIRRNSAKGLEGVVTTKW